MILEYSFRILTFSHASLTLNYILHLVTLAICTQKCIMQVSVKLMQSNTDFLQ